nr:5592_t:CDS:2 [Entrophospora candida]
MSNSQNFNSTVTTSEESVVGPPTWRKVVYTSLAALTFLYLTITIILFYTRRKNISDIKYRPMRLNILNTVAIIVLSFTCRVLAFTWVVKYNLAKLRMSMAYSQPSFYNNTSNPPISPMSPMRERLEFPESKLMNRLRKFRQYVTDKWLTSWVITPIMILVLIGSSIAQIINPTISIIPLNTNCSTIGPGAIPLFVLIGFFLIIVCPILFYLLYGINDAFGLRNELMVTLISGVVAYVCYFVFELLLRNWRNYVGSFMFGWVTLILGHTLSITIPVIKSFKNKKFNSSSSSSGEKILKTGSKKYAQFEKVLADRELFESYKICAAACFCTELVIFLQEYQFLKLLVAQSCTPTSKELLPPLTPKLCVSDSGQISFTDGAGILDTNLTSATLISPSLISTPCTVSIVNTVSAASWIPFPHELKNDYLTFYDTFFDTNSDLAINFSGNLLNIAKNKIEKGQYEISMYESSRDEPDAKREMSMPVTGDISSPHSDNNIPPSLATLYSTSSFRFGNIKNSSSNGSNDSLGTHSKYSESQQQQKTDLLPFYRRPRFTSFITTIVINFIFPFINGVMLGLGEICANEIAFRMEKYGTGIGKIKLKKKVMPDGKEIDDTEIVYVQVTPVAPII